MNKKNEHLYCRIIKSINRVNLNLISINVNVNVDVNVNVNGDVDFDFDGHQIVMR